MAQDFPRTAAPRRADSETRSCCGVRKEIRPAGATFLEASARPCKAEIMCQKKETFLTRVFRGIPSKMGNMLMGGVEPPVVKRFKTSKKVYPAEQHNRDALVEDFLEVYGRLERLIVRAKGLDLGAASVGLPVPLFRMKLGQSIAFELAHARRHLWQARQVRNEAAFPTN